MSKEKTQTAVSSLSFTAPETCFYRADSTALKVKFSFLSQTNLAENLFQMSQVCFLHHLFGLWKEVPKTRFMTLMNYPQKLVIPTGISAW